MTRSGEWFKIASGEHKGRWHLAGWMGTAILTLPTGRGDPPGGKWLALGICPRCRATIITEKTTHGDQSWAHEDWHAATDYPHQDET